MDLSTKDPLYASCNKARLYSYYTRRAFPNHRAIALDLRLTAPPIQLIATSFRDTKGGAEEAGRLGDRLSSSLCGMPFNQSSRRPELPNRNLARRQCLIFTDRHTKTNWQIFCVRMLCFLTASLCAWFVFIPQFFAKRGYISFVNKKVLLRSILLDFIFVDCLLSTDM
jgi:hypothetical protein